MGFQRLAQAFVIHNMRHLFWSRHSETHSCHLNIDSDKKIFIDSTLSAFDRHEDFMSQKFKIKLLLKFFDWLWNISMHLRVYRVTRTYDWNT